MRIKVEFPVLGNRIVKNYMEKIEEGNYSAIAVKTLVCQIKIDKLTCDENDQGVLRIEYSEDYSDEATFSGVMNKAECFAQDYCKKLSGELQSAAPCETAININVNSILQNATALNLR